MYPKLSPNNGYRWCPLGKLSHLGLEQLYSNIKICGPGSLTYWILQQMPLAALKIEKILWNSYWRSTLRNPSIWFLLRLYLIAHIKQLIFTIHTYASDKQLGAIISQHNRTYCIFIEDINQATTYLQHEREVNSTNRRRGMTKSTPHNLFCY